MECRQCSKDLNRALGPDICANCSKLNLQKTLAQYPELGAEIKQHFEEQKRRWENKAKEREDHE